MSTRAARSPASSTKWPRSGGRQEASTLWAMPGERVATRCGRSRAPTASPTCRSSPTGPRAVLRRRRRPGPPDGGHAAAGHAGGAAGAVRRAAVEAHVLVVRVRRGGPQHPRRSRALHGRARRRAPHDRDPGASHAVSVAHPAATAHLVLEAAAVNVAVSAGGGRAAIAAVRHRHSRSEASCSAKRAMASQYSNGPQLTRATPSSASSASGRLRRQPQQVHRAADLRQEAGAAQPGSHRPIGYTQSAPASR